MNVPTDWPLFVIAGVAAAVAIFAGADFDVAIPLGVIAVVAAGLLLTGSLRRLAWRRPPAPPMAPPTAASTLRAAFRSGRSGRISIVSELDRIERMGPHPALAMRSIAEETRIQHLPRTEFREYVRTRLDAIEEADR
ncbi:MAG: hypothetical protein ACLPZM_06975 [Thermoplasmata archaeon]